MTRRWVRRRGARRRATVRLFLGYRYITQALESERRGLCARSFRAFAGLPGLRQALAIRALQASIPVGACVRSSQPPARTRRRRVGIE